MSQSVEVWLLAQRRPGPRPRRHDWMCASVRSPDGAQRRPGPRPRRHLERHALPVLRALRSTKAGAETPATHGKPGNSEMGAPTLNEGRGRDPGDTRGSCGHWSTGSSAQRRPGPRPRRHPGRMEQRARVRPRSTKAGAETPATRPRVVGGRRGPHRSTKAGAETPATQRKVLVLRPSHGRSTKAGAETPATHQLAGRVADDLARSTKAGAETPATPYGLGEVIEITVTAQRRPGPRPRRHGKADAGRHT